jgi:hypothetical protein
MKEANYVDLGALTLDIAPKTAVGQVSKEAQQK